MIRRCDHVERKIISLIYFKEKQDDSFRLTLSLKNLYKNKENAHFKRETITSILRTNMCFSTIDLKNAYYETPILDEHQKHLKFANKDHIYIHIKIYLLT